MNQKSDQDGDWTELWRGARVAGVAVVSAIVTATAVIAFGEALMPDREAQASPSLHIVSDR